jgi:phage tail tape-measure protein
MRAIIKLMTSALTTCLAIGVMSGGCETMEKNPRTTGTVGGAIAGAAIGAAVDKDKPVRGAAIGGAAGGAAGNVGGQVYKDNKD